jgi:hypothetical protein
VNLRLACNDLIFVSCFKYGDQEMLNQSRGRMKRQFEARALIFGFTGLLLAFFAGCETVRYFKPAERPFDKELAEGYELTRLKESSSADVLGIIGKPEYELLSQSKSVVASVGQKKDGHAIWLNMAAFEENSLFATRKYFFFIDEKIRRLLYDPARKLRFFSEMVLERELLDKPYADENARRIVIIEKVLENVRRDIDSVSPDNEMLNICGMMISQTLETVLQKLSRSPVLAGRLSTASGLEFEHITLGKGFISLGVAGDIVSVNVKVGVQKD